MLKVSIMCLSTLHNQVCCLFDNLVINVIVDELLDTIATHIHTWFKGDMLSNNGGCKV